MSLPNLLDLLRLLVSATGELEGITRLGGAGLRTLSCLTR